MNVFELGGVLAGFVGISALIGVLSGAMLAPMAMTASSVTNGVTSIFDGLPSELESGQLSEASYIYASDGVTRLATYYWENRIVVPLDKVSVHLQNAVIATEDRRFYEHGAIDLLGIPRAFVNNQLGNDTQGASTLTQQYVKNVLIEQAHSVGDVAGVQAAKETSYERKLREMKLAIALEQRLTKDEVLQGYLNIAQFGSSVYGVESAAQHYFSVSAADLTIVQAATIAGITQQPTAYDPTLHPEASETRRNTVLALMLREGYITQAEHDEAAATPIADTLNVRDIQPGCVAAGDAAFFCDYVTKVLVNDPVFGDTAEERRNLLYRGGLSIITTIDMAQTTAATQLLKQTIPAEDENGIATALAAVEPGTGQIKVLAQNRSYDPSSEAAPYTTAINYSVNQAYGGGWGFQSGSTFKAYTLTEWLLEGHTLNERVSASNRTYTSNDFTASCTTLGTDTWSPRNSDGSGSGSVSVLRATAYSINTAFASMEYELDLCGLAETATAVGFRPSMTSDTDVQILPAMTLGVQNTSPLAQANAYATFAAGGMYCEPIAIASVTDRNGDPLPVPEAKCRRTIPANVANTVTYALEQVLSSQGGAKNSVLADGRPAAGKTGTAQESKATWFVGYTPQLSAAVWIGNPEGEFSMSNITINGTYYRGYIYGSTIAAPTWKAFMDTAMAGQPATEFPEPDQNLVGKAPVVVQATETPAADAPAAEAPAEAADG